MALEPRSSIDIHSNGVEVARRGLGRHAHPVRQGSDAGKWACGLYVSNVHCVVFSGFGAYSGASKAW